VWLAAILEGPRHPSTWGRVLLSMVDDTSGARFGWLEGSDAGSTAGCFGTPSRKPSENFLAATAKIGLKPTGPIRPVATFFSLPSRSHNQGWSVILSRNGAGLKLLRSKLEMKVTIMKNRVDRRKADFMGQGSLPIYTRARDTKRWPAFSQFRAFITITGEGDLRSNQKGFGGRWTYRPPSPVGGCGR